MGTSTEARAERAGTTALAVARTRSATPALCGLAAVAIALLAVIAYLTGNDGRVSVLVHMSPLEPMAQVARLDPLFQFVDPPAHYDGVYFYAMALDPIALGREHTLIDQAANRYGHPAYAWAAAIVALGQQRLLPWALLLIGLASLFIAGVAASDLSVLLGWSPWLGMAVALNPGLIYAVTADTSEVLGAALMLTTLLAWLSGRRRLAAVLLVPLCFAKEPLLAVPVGIGAWEVLEWLRHRIIGVELRRRLLLLAPGLVLYGIWLTWVHARFGVYPFEVGPGRIGPPFVGWADALSRAAGLATGSADQMQIGQAAVAFLAVIFGATILGMAAALRLRTAIDPIFLLTGLLTTTLGWITLLYPKDMIRIMAFAFVLLPYVFLGRRRGLADEQRATDPTPANPTSPAPPVSPV